MAEKKAAEKKQTTSSTRKIQKGDAYLCEICGLQVNVDLCGEYLESKGLNCCGKPMKEKSKAKA